MSASRGVPVVVWMCWLASGCTTHYAYDFQPADPGARLMSTTGERFVVDDATVTAELQVMDDAIEVALTNRTTSVLQVDWDHITISRGDQADHAITALHPATDLGWLQPGAKVTTRLVPFVLPRSGDEAARYHGRRLELVVPMIANHEPKTYRFHVIARVRAE